MLERWIIFASFLSRLIEGQIVGSGPECFIDEGLLEGACLPYDQNGISQECENLHGALVVPESDRANPCGAFQEVITFFALD
jgi:hypothetical protein